MNAKHKILPAVCCIALMSSCASNQSTTSAAPWSVKPAVASKKGSEKPEAMYQLGRYYQGQNRFTEAINAYSKALKADSGYAEANNGLGVIYSRQGKYAEAIEAFKAAIKSTPKAAHLYSNLGYAYYLQGQYAESVKALQQATALDPNNKRALNNLGLAYAKAGNTLGSALAFSDAISADQRENSKQTSTNESAKAIPAMAAVDVTVLKTTAQPEAETLALPKDRGLIKSVDADKLVLPTVESRAKLVQVAPNVSELQIKPEYNQSAQLAAVEQGAEFRNVKLEVANGNGVRGAAGKVGRFLREQGYATARLTNQKPFKTQTTQIQYRAGYEQQAQQLQTQLLDSPALVQRNDLRTNVRVVLGKDMVTQLAYYEQKAQALQLAESMPKAKQF